MSKKHNHDFKFKPNVKSPIQGMDMSKHKPYQCVTCGAIQFRSKEAK